MEVIALNNGFKLPKVRIPLWFAVLFGRIFDVAAFITKKDLPINSDRMKKFSISTEYYSEKIREKGYVQNHSVEDEIKRTCEWYLESKK